MLVVWILASSALYIVQGQLDIRDWGNILTSTGFAISILVNALVTGLIVFRIFKVFREVKTTVDDRILGMTGGSKLRRIIFVLTESGILLFSIQMAQLVLYRLQTNIAIDAYDLIAPLSQLQMLNVIIISIITTLNFTDQMFLF